MQQGTVVIRHSALLLYAYLNLAPPEMVSVYGKGRMSVSPSSILTNTE